MRVSIKLKRHKRLIFRKEQSTRLNSGEFNLRPQTVVQESAITQPGRTAAEEGCLPRLMLTQCTQARTQYTEKSHKYHSSSVQCTKQAIGAVINTNQFDLSLAHKLRANTKRGWVNSNAEGCYRWESRRRREGRRGEGVPSIRKR